VVLQIGADARSVGPYVYPECLECGPRANSGAEQNCGRLESSGGENRLARQEAFSLAG
jgi:hypothetical protein